MAEIPGFPGKQFTYESPTAAGAAVTPPDNEPDHGVEDSANAQRMYLRSGESLNSELIAVADRPDKLFLGLRRLEEMLEDTIIPQGLSERYTPPRDETIMYEKYKNFSLSPDDLEELEIIVPGTYNLKGKNEAKLTDETFLSLALKVDQVPIYIPAKDEHGKIQKDNNGNILVELDMDGDPREVGTKSIIIIGTPEQRKDMADANEMGAKELGVRDVMGEHIGMRINEEIRDSYETMSAYMHSGRTPKFSTEQLRTLFNMPSLKELRARNKLPVKDRKELKEYHELGDMVEEAMFCQFLMLASNSKQRIQDLLARPGSRDLILRMANKQLVRDGGDTTFVTDEVKIKYWIKENLGDIDNWVDDDKRKLKETWREERRTGLRKGLAEWSNIAAWEGNPGEFGEDKENAFMEYVGKLVGGKDVNKKGKEEISKEGVEASWLAATFTRVIGGYSAEGYAALPNGQFLLNLGEDRFISSDDFGKAYALLFNRKEGEAGRPSGLKDMIGKIPDLAITLFDWAQVVVGMEEDRNPDGTLNLNPDGSIRMREKRRSIMDAWLGTAEQPKKSLLKGGPVEVTLPDSYYFKKDKDGKLLKDTNGNHIWLGLTESQIKAEEIKFRQEMIDSDQAMILDGKVVWKVTEEKGSRLGSLNFKSLPKRFHGTYTIMQWLMGNERGPTGVNIEALNQDFEYRDFRLNALKKIKKYVGIVMNPVVLTRGSQHLYVDAAGDSKIIQRNYFRNLMIARINSETFTEGILNGTIKLFNPDGPAAEVPMPVLILRFIKEALKPNPTGEREIRRRYVDENKVLRRLGGGGTPGITEDVTAILTEEFLPEDEIEKFQKRFDESNIPEEKIFLQAKINSLKDQMQYVGRVTGLSPA